MEGGGGGKSSGGGGGADTSGGGGGAARSGGGGGGDGILVGTTDGSMPSPFIIWPFILLKGREVERDGLDYGNTSKTSVARRGA